MIELERPMPYSLNQPGSHVSIGQMRLAVRPGA